MYFFPFMYIQNFQATVDRNFWMYTEKKSSLFSTFFSYLVSKIIDVIN